jgi:predicted oxidoreductase
VARAFEDLHAGGKVRHFGVSNYDAFQIDLLKTCVRQPLVVNQIQLGLANPGVLAEGMEFTISLLNGARPKPQTLPSTRGGTIEYCRSNSVQLQAWRPIRAIMSALEDDKAHRLAVSRAVSDLAQRLQASCAAVALGWLLAHPAGIVPIVGTSSPTHLIEACGADRISLSSAEWYDLLAAAAQS